jgi:hypothetical protein
MRARTMAFLLGAVLVFYLAMCGWKGSLALYDGFHQGSAAAGLLGGALLAFGFLGSWFLVREIQFGFATERLALALDAEDGLRQEEIDALPRSPGGRVERAAADRLFARRKAETEARPRTAPAPAPPCATRSSCKPTASRMRPPGTVRAAAPYAEPPRRGRGSAVRQTSTTTGTIMGRRRKVSETHFPTVRRTSCWSW